MPMHSDRRETRKWAKSGPPRRGCRWKPHGCVVSLARVPDQHCATLLAEKLPATITVGQSHVIWL